MKHRNRILSVISAFAAAVLLMTSDSIALRTSSAEVYTQWIGEDENPKSILFKVSSNQISITGYGVMKDFKGNNYPAQNFRSSPVHYAKIDERIGNLGNYLFYSCSDLQTLDTTSIGRIGAHTFENCISLEELPPLPLYTIGAYAFRKCTSLTTVPLPDGVKYICVGAFENCTALQEITIPDSVILFEKYAFYNCSSLRSVTLGSSIPKIESWTFEGCDSLHSITIPASVQEIESFAFGSSEDDYALDVTILNPDCKLTYASFSGVKNRKNLTLRGYSGSTAEKYALSNEATFISLEAAPSQQGSGDIDHDGRCRLADAVLLMRAIAEDGDPGEYDFDAADMDDDGMLTVTDAALLSQKLRASDWDETWENYIAGNWKK